MELAEPHRQQSAALTLVGAASLAVWFLIGQLREGNGADYILRVPELDRRIELALGLLSLSVAVVAADRVLGDRDWLVARGWWRVYSRLLAAGVMVAVGGRVVTAASGGANIGGGFIMMFGPLPVIYLLAQACQEAIALRSSEMRHGGPDWAVAGGEVIVLKTLALICAGYLALVLVPTPGLIVLGAIGTLGWLAAAR